MTRSSPSVRLEETLRPDGFLFAAGAALAVILSVAPAGAGAASISVHPTEGPPGTILTIKGNGFGPSEIVTIRFDSQKLGSRATDPSGRFSTRLGVPSQAQPGAHVITAIGRDSDLSAQAPFTVQTDWPHLRFDQDHTGVNPFENVLHPGNVPDLSLVWQAQLGQPVFASSPAVVDGVVYIGSSDGRLWAVDADGCGSDLCTDPLWIGDASAQILSSPAVANGLVFVGSQASPTSNDGRLNAFDASGCGEETCAPLWKGLAGPESILESSPAVWNGIVFIGSFDGKLYAFDAGGCGQALCMPLWTGATGDHIESSPTVSGGAVYIGSNDGRLYAFDASGCGGPECEPLWSAPAGGGPIFASSPALSNGVVYVAASNSLAAFDAAGCGQASCQPLWKGTYHQDFFNGSPAVHQNRVYIGQENGLGVYAASGCGQSTCGPLWLGFAPGAQAVVASSPAVANGVVYVGRNTGEVLAWEADDCGEFICNSIWSGMTGDPVVDSSPAVVNGVVYIGSSNQLFPYDISGRLYAYSLGEP